MLSQGVPRNAAVNLATYGSLQRHRAAFLPQHGFLSATVHMLKLHKLRWFSWSWREITPIAENHSTRPVKATMIDVIDDTDNIGPSPLRDLCPFQERSAVAAYAAAANYVLACLFMYTVEVCLRFYALIGLVQLHYYYYRAMLRRAGWCHSMSCLCPSVRPYVTFRYRDHRLEYLKNNFTAE